MAVLSLIADPGRYVPSEWDLVADAEGRGYWLSHFRRHWEHFERLLAGPVSPERLAAFRTDYMAGLDRLERQPDWLGRLDILTLDQYRQDKFDEYGFPDPYERIKRDENAAAIALYPEVIAEIDAAGAAERRAMLIRGILAGNIFDLGSFATIDSYHADGLDFHATRQRLGPRPWLVDDLDAWVARMRGGPAYRKVLFFVDNAGADVILGCLPLARELASAGSEVVLAANTRPALNDITAEELADVLGRLAPLDARLGEALAARRLRVVASGNGIPLIDLSKVSDACNAEAADADLLILEGMGRSVESNSHVAFTCDCLKIALLKDPGVAARLGGRLYDIVCRFERSG